jgi:hypothetical protein
MIDEKDVQFLQEKLHFTEVRMKTPDLSTTSIEKLKIIYERTKNELESKLKTVPA